MSAKLRMPINWDKSLEDNDTGILEFPSGHLFKSWFKSHDKKHLFAITNNGIFEIIKQKDKNNPFKIVQLNRS